MKRVHTEIVREPIIKILEEKKILSAEQIARELRAYFREHGVPGNFSKEEEEEFINSIKRVSLYVVLSSLEKDGIIVGIPARNAPVISTNCYWMFSKKEKVWMLEREYRKYLEEPGKWVKENKNIVIENCYKNSS